MKLLYEIVFGIIIGIIISQFYQLYTNINEVDWQPQGPRVGYRGECGFDELIGPPGLCYQKLASFLDQIK
jgi:hypothetical protein